MKGLLQPILRNCSTVSLLKIKKVNCNYLRSVTTFSETEPISQKNFISVNESIIEKKLKEFTLPYKSGYTCYYATGCELCSFSGTKNLSKKGGIYINKRTGFFLCNICKSSGNWLTFCELAKRKSNSKDLNEKISLEEVKLDKYVSTDEWSAVIKNSDLISTFNDIEYQKIFTDFKLFSCPKARAEKMQIRISKSKNLLYVPMYCNDHSVAGYKTLSLTGDVDTCPENDCPGFLKSMKNVKSAVVVSDIKDFFALLSQDIEMEILCLPHGNSYLPQNTLPFLENYNNLVLWLGGANSMDTTTHFAKKLGEKRCLIVRPTPNQVNACQVVASHEKVIHTLKNAKSAWHECIISFSDLRDEVLSELQNNNQCLGTPWVRFPALNKILKGHRRGELTILTGPTGSGKTTFISEYSLDLAMQGVNTLWGSFEIKNSRLARKMLQQFARLPLEENLDKFPALADKFEKLPIFFMTFYGQQPIQAVMDAVEHCSYVHDIAHVVIDNIQFMIDVTSDSGNFDRFWKQDTLIQSFRSFASKHNCHVTLVMHPKKGMDGVNLSINSIFGGAKAAQEADNILIIQNKISHSFTKKKYLQICKNRFSGELGGMPLNFDPLSFGFSKVPVNQVYSNDDLLPDYDQSQEIHTPENNYGNRYFNNSYETEEIKYQDQSQWNKMLN